LYSIDCPPTEKGKDCFVTRPDCKRMPGYIQNERCIAGCPNGKKLIKGKCYRLFPIDCPKTDKGKNCFVTLEECKKVPGRIENGRCVKLYSIDCPPTEKGKDCFVTRPGCLKIPGKIKGDRCIRKCIGGRKVKGVCVPHCPPYQIHVNGKCQHISITPCKADEVLKFGSRKCICKKGLKRINGKCVVPPKPVVSTPPPPPKPVVSTPPKTPVPPKEEPKKPEEKIPEIPDIPDVKIPDIEIPDVTSCEEGYTYNGAFCQKVPPVCGPGTIYNGRYCQRVPQECPPGRQKDLNGFCVSVGIIREANQVHRLHQVIERLVPKMKPVCVKRIQCCRQNSEQGCCKNNIVSEHSRRVARRLARRMRQLTRRIARREDTRHLFSRTQRLIRRVFEHLQEQL